MRLGSLGNLFNELILSIIASNLAILPSIVVVDSNPAIVVPSVLC